MAPNWWEQAQEDREMTYTKATLEASMGTAEAKKYASTTNVGRRKYRLEGSRAGNSRFLYLPTAERMKRAYGGTIVDHRPAKPPAYLVESTKLPDCPSCGAHKGRPCKFVGSGKSRRPHASRKKLVST